MKSIEWKNGAIVALDQTRLPHATVYLRLRSPAEVAKAIREMRIRGAPLIGAAATLALAQTARRSKSENKERLLIELKKTANLIRQTRPTAVNLFNALEEVLAFARDAADGKNLAEGVVRKCLELVERDAALNRDIGVHGSRLVDDGDVLLTHCNAGALATVDYGTALAVVRAAKESGKNVQVIATETRPLLQGARLTAYELKRLRIPVKIIADTAAGILLRRGEVDKVIVGADRIFVDGHVVNKIGTYMIAAAAKMNGVPFYVAAPTSTVDRQGNARKVVIEERSPREVLEIFGRPIAPRGVTALNPAFDVTPPDLITAIITERGIIYPPFSELEKT